MKKLSPVLFINLLLNLTESHLNIPTILDSLDHNSLTADYVTAINELMQKGVSFSQSICHAIPKIRTYEKFISLSEETGDLIPALKYVKQELESKDQLAHNLLAVSAYPAMAVTVALAGSILLYTKALPVLMKLSSITSVIVMDGILWAGVWLLGSISVVTLICLYLLTRNHKQYQLYRNLSFLCGSGISIDRALELTLVDMPDRAVLSILDGVRSGKTFYESTMMSEKKQKKDDLYVKTWLLAAEQTGETVRYFNLIAEYFEKQQKKAQETVIRIMEPAVTVIAGGYILILVLTILVPFFGSR